MLMPNYKLSYFFSHFNFFFQQRYYNNSFLNVKKSEELCFKRISFTEIKLNVRH